MKIILDLSPNFSKKRRKNSEISYIIIHYTGMQSEIESLKRLKNKKSNVSCHYLIGKQGNITQLVRENRIAWHAGKSKWKNFKNLNKNSIGIELVNKGHNYGYEKFPLKQIKSLIYLCKKLRKKYKIDKKNFLGHSDISPLRKDDPGEKFPWKRLSKLKIGNWYLKKDFLKIKVKKYNAKKMFFKNLYKIGYRYFSIYKRSRGDVKVIKAFQRRYLPSNVTGRIDIKTLKISYFLANQVKSS